MNGTLQELSAAGYKRIWKITTKAENSFVPFMASAYELNMMLQNYKIQPYSLMRYWQSIFKLSDKEAGGLKRIMQEALSLVTYVDKVDETSQRKFRHIWSTVWASFATAVGMSEYDKDVLMSLGLKLPIFLAAVEHDDIDALKLVKDAESYPLVSELSFDMHRPCALFDNLCNVRILCEFYNLVLGWYCSVRNERDVEELIDYLVISDFKEFKDYFKLGDKVWVAEG